MSERAPRGEGRRSDVVATGGARRGSDAAATGGARRQSDSPSAGSRRRRSDAAPEPLPIVAVEAAAARAGLRAGDCIVRIADEVPTDVFDLELAAAEGVFTVAVLRDGHPLEFTLRLGEDEWHGISLGHGGLGSPTRLCRNRCRFCFVDQVPPGLRASLGVKDDDYRLSFLDGNFTTLSNLDDDDLARIERLRLEPLYVSLHVWDDEARVKLMGRAARTSRRHLERLAAAELELHVQIVFCPGWNDGELLTETVAELAALASVADVGIVPVSLAEGGDLRRVTHADAGSLLATVGEWQRRFRDRRGVNFVHAGDEFWLLAGELPPESDAPDQYENGIGMSAALLAEADALVAEWHDEGVGDVTRRCYRVLCGTLAEPVIVRLAELLGGAGVELTPFAIANELFGAHVTVTGLLGGREVLAALAARPLAADEWLLAPRDFLPLALGRTLDEVEEGELAAACNGRLIIAASLADAFARMPE